MLVKIEKYIVCSMYRRSYLIWSPVIAHFSEILPVATKATSIERCFCCCFRFQSMFAKKKLERTCAYRLAQNVSRCYPVTGCAPLRRGGSFDDVDQPHRVGAFRPSRREEGGQGQQTYCSTCCMVLVYDTTFCSSSSSSRRRW